MGLVTSMKSLLLQGDPEGLGLDYVDINYQILGVPWAAGPLPKLPTAQAG